MSISSGPVAAVVVIAAVAAVAGLARRASSACAAWAARVGEGLAVGADSGMGGVSEVAGSAALANGEVDRAGMRELGPIACSCVA